MRGATMQIIIELYNMLYESVMYSNAYNINQDLDTKSSYLVFVNIIVSQKILFYLMMA